MNRHARGKGKGSYGTRRKSMNDEALTQTCLVHFTWSPQCILSAGTSELGCSRSEVLYLELPRSPEFLREAPRKSSLSKRCCLSRQASQEWDNRAVVLWTTGNLSFFFLFWIFFGGGANSAVLRGYS